MNLSPSSASNPFRSVRWRRVGLFYALVLGWALVVTAGLYLTGQRDLSSVSLPLAAGLTLGYLPAPLVAALIVQRREPGGSGIGLAVSALRRGFARAALISALVVAALLIVWLILSWVAGNQLDVAGAGVLVTSPEDLLANALYPMGSMSAADVAGLRASLPSFAVVILIGYLGAMFAGFTINGVLAFGEEYGWRGWLADELRPLGAFWANVVTGLAWGLWYTPLIVLGYNYGGSKVAPAFMIAWCVVASFLLWRARQVTGSLLAPSVIHGAINALGGLFMLVVANPNPLIAAPLGAIGTAGLALVTAVFWLATRKRVASIG